MLRAREDEWLWGWDPTPGVVSVWADASGRAFVWRRLPESRALVREDERFRPWILLASLEDLEHLGSRLRPERDGTPAERGVVTYRELEGQGLRYWVSADDGRALTLAVQRGASRRLGRAIRHVRDLPEQSVLWLAPEEQYLVASGRTYFRGLAFDDLARLQLDLETTGLDPEHDRIFLAALRDPAGRTTLIEAPRERDEAELVRRLVQSVVAADPDVIENHNLHGFDLPFLAARARRLGVPLALGRAGAPGFVSRPAARGTPLEREGDEDGDAPPRRTRLSLVGRELIDTMDAVLRYDFAARDLPGHGLKAVARHFDLARSDRELIEGASVYAVYCKDPERVRRYASDDVAEAEALSKLLGGAAFALARMAPRRYERVADAGPATGVLDPLLVRAYLRSGAALPQHAPDDGTPHQGAALYLFATGVAERVVKADVASLYPSLMRTYRIGPARDRLGALLSLVDRLLEQRLEAKAKARAAKANSPERHTQEALSAAMKIVINSAYGYLGAVGLTRLSDVHAANEITRLGRAVLDRLCHELAARGVTLLEADTDGVYFSVPPGFSEADEQRVVAEVAATLPSGVQLELEGRYAAMLSHEPKNYALKGYDGQLLLRGVAFRSRRAEPFGEVFLRRALDALLAGNVGAVRRAYVDTVDALRRRELPTRAVSTEVRLTKSAEQYALVRERRRELPYEALLGAGRARWRLGERIRVYRALGGRAALLPESGQDARDYDVAYYVRLLRDTFAARLARALAPEDFAATFADAEQLSLFDARLEQARPVLNVLFDATRLPSVLEPPPSA